MSFTHTGTNGTHPLIPENQEPDLFGLLSQMTGVGNLPTEDNRLPLVKHYIQPLSTAISDAIVANSAVNLVGLRGTVSTQPDDAFHCSGRVTSSSASFTATTAPRLASTMRHHR